MENKYISGRAFLLSSLKLYNCYVYTMNHLNLLMPNRSSNSKLFDAESCPNFAVSAGSNSENRCQNI